MFMSHLSLYSQPRIPVTGWLSLRTVSSRIQVPLLTTNTVGCEREAVRIGMPVQATFEDVTEEISLVMFRPVGREERGSPQRGRPG